MTHIFIGLSCDSMQQKEGPGEPTWRAQFIMRMM